jgi:hypothetical protein
MKAICLFVAMFLPATALAGPLASKDRTIDAAAAAIVAARMGDLRGGFRFDEKPSVTKSDNARVASRPNRPATNDVWRDGLAPALPAPGQGNL